MKNNEKNIIIKMALNCKINTPVLASCDTSVSGIIKMWFANWSENHTFSASGSDCVIDTIDIGAEKFYPVNIMDNTGVATADLNAGANADSKSIKHTVSGLIGNIDCDLLGDWKNYLLGRVIIAVLTKNREVMLLGADNGLVTTTFNFTTGAAEGDATGISFVYEGVQANPYLRIKDAQTITALT